MHFSGHHIEMARMQMNKTAVPVIIALTFALAMAAGLLALVAMREAHSAGESSRAAASSQEIAKKSAETSQGASAVALATPSLPQSPRADAPVSGHMQDVRVHQPAPEPPIGQWGLSAGEPFKQIGIVYSTESGTRMPLYARRAPYHNSRMQYFVGTGDSRIQVSARVGDRDCAESIGCEEIYTGDEVRVPEVDPSPLTVKLFAQ